MTSQYTSKGPASEESRGLSCTSESVCSRTLKDVMSPQKMEQFTSILADARSAFGTDPSYAILFAQQARIVQARRDPRPTVVDLRSARELQPAAAG